jgi:hypothetical protein
VTPDTLATAGLVAALPAGGVGVIAAVTSAGMAHPVRGPVALALAMWVVLGAYMAVVFGW